MKKLLSMALVVAMLLSMVSVVSAADWTDNAPTVSVSATQPDANGKLTASIKLACDKTCYMGGFTLKLLYDDSLVTVDREAGSYTTSSKGVVTYYGVDLPDVLKSEKPTINPEASLTYGGNSRKAFSIVCATSGEIEFTEITMTMHFVLTDAAKASGGKIDFVLVTDSKNNFAVSDSEGELTLPLPTVDSIKASVAAPIRAAVVSGTITTPANGAADESSVSGTGLTANVSWSPALTEGKFVDNTAYTATVTVTPADGYAFADNATVSGLDGFTFSKQANGSYTASKTYEKTAKNPSVVTSVEVTANTIAVPTAVEATKTVTMTATVKDQYGDAMNGQTIGWSIPTTTGVSIEAATGIVAAQPAATAGAVTVTATVGGKTGTGTLTVTKAEPVATTITGTTDGAGLKQAFTIPVNDTNDTAKAYAVTVKDQYGAEIANAPVTWTISPTVAGVSIAADGTVTVTKAAAEAITTSQEFTLTAKDASNDQTGTTVTVARAASVATTVKLYKDGTELNGTDTIIIPTGDTANTYTYTAKVFDQYGTEMTAAKAALTLATADEKVTFNSTTGVVSVAKGATVNKTYTLTATYEGKSASATLTAKDIEITAPTVTPVSATYGMTWAQIVPQTAITGGSAKLNGVTVPGAFYLKTSGTPAVGEQDYEVWFKSTDDAYDVPAKSGKVTVAAKPITATVTAVSKTYGEANPSFEFTLADGALVGSDTKDGLGLTLNCAATATSGVGTYNVTGTATNTSYIVTVAGTNALTVTAKTLTDAMVEVIPAQTYSKEAKEPAVTVKDGGKTLTKGTDFTVSYTNNTNAGTAGFTVTGKGNYSGAVNKTFLIHRKPVTVSGITAENRNYDGSSTVTLVFTGVTFDGLVSGDTLTVTATGTMADANVGTGKTVTISGLSLGGASKDNYVLAAEGQQSTTTVTISKQPAAPLSVTAENAVYTGVAYAGSNLTPSRSADAVAYTYYADNSGVKGEALEGAPTNVGSYWVVGKIAESENIAAAEAEAVKFSITRAALTVTAKDKTVTYGDEPANDGVEYEGFVNGETESVLKTAVEYAYNYEQFGKVGEYVITVKSAAADNYEISFVPGKLTVAQKEVGLTWTEADSFYYNGKAQSVTATATGMVNEDALTVTVVGGAQTAIGSYTAKATALTGAKAANYKLPETQTKAYTIVAALESVTLSPATVTGTVDNSTLTVKLSGYVEEGTTPEISGYEIVEGKITVSGVEYTVDTSAVVVKPANVEIAAAESKVDESQVVDTTEKTDDEKAAVETVKNSTENTIENVTEAAAQTIIEEAKQAGETLDSKLTEQQKTELGEDVTIEANIVVSITPTNIDFTSEKKIMNLNITPEIQLKAKGNGHTVDLDSVPVEELATWTLVKVQIPAGFTPTVAKHTHGNVTEWLKVTVVEEGGKYFATWSQKSFSDVELVADPRTATVNFIFADEHGETKTYAAADVNTALPTDSKSGNTFKGWDFFVDGSETAVAGGPFKTMTDALLTALDAAVTSVSAESVFEPIQSFFAEDYSVKISASEKGTVTASVSSAFAGKTVTLTVKPEKGFTLEILAVTTQSGKEISLTKVKKNVYTFTMPGGDVTVKATFMEDNSMLNFFVDVPADAFYYDAVLWAAENEITKGVDDVHFAPTMLCTRAQMVTFLWRVAGCPTVSGVSNPFTDVEAGTYYYDAVLWAVKEGITKGKGAETTFAPDDTISRGEAVTFLFRAAKASAVTGSNPFTDVDADSYCYDAVLWAAKNEITKGKGSETIFAADDLCDRSQMVTFLYRCFAEEE